MITKLRIQNFKGWKDTGELRLAPITVLFGGNSSGKSSVGQFLMMLKQTTESNDRAAGLQLGGGQRSIVDMGTWEDMVYGHQAAADLSFHLEWELPQQIRINDPIKDRDVTGCVLSLESQIGQIEAKGNSAGFIRCKEFRYGLSDENQEVLSAQLSPSKTEVGKFEVKATGLDLIRNKGRGWQFPGPQRFYGFPQEVNAYHQNAQGLEDLSLSVEKLFQNIAYLGPLRAHPKRQYIWSGETPPDVGIEGENWVSAYLSSSERMISPGMGRKRAINAKPFKEVIGRWLKQIGLVYDFEAKPVAEGTREYRARVKVSPRSAWVSVPDVGFGISQFMPVLVQCFYAPANSVVVIEQPELHLHPAIQQNLADLLIEVIHSREGTGRRNIQLIIESHSEHFLGRLQRRIAEEKISKDDVAAYFLSQNLAGTHEAKRLEVDLFGNIRNWPPNFFGDSFGDVAGRQKASLERRKKLKSAEVEQ
jgi:predicted ATPase